MKKYIFLSILSMASVAFSSVSAQEQKVRLTAKTPYEFVPQGYKLYSEFWGDLNKDSINDCVLIIKATDKKAIVYDEYRGELDRNRRGIVIAFKKGENYELILQNSIFFESENEYGGIYFAPELDWNINYGNLIFSYSHGRYGRWNYIFRYQNNDFELIGYDNYVGSLQYSKTEFSINFLTKKMKTTIFSEEEDEPFPKYEPEIQWKNIKVDKFYKLSEGTIDDAFNYVYYNCIDK